VHALTDAFAPAYMQRAWFELALLSVSAGVLGVFVVLRRLAFATHALGVGTFPGVVVAFGLGAAAFAGGLIAALACAGLIAALQRRRDLDAPAATGIVLVAALALGALLVSDVFSTGAQVDSLLFGSVLGVTDGDLARSGAMAAVALVAVLLLGRAWLLVAFDRENAPALGFSPGRLDLALLGVLALAVVASVDAVGSLLVSALFVVPAGLARLLVGRLVPLVVTSVVVTLVLSTGGLLLSYHTGAPPGATIAALAAGAFIAVFVLRALAEPRRRRLALAGAVAAGVLVAAGCGGGSGASGPAPQTAAALQVAATTTQVADWVREVGGSNVDVTQLLEPNVDPHDFEPTPKDLAAVADADIVFASGAGLDTQIDDAIQNIHLVQVVPVAPTSSLRPAALAHGGGGGSVDPHFWGDPTLVIQAVGTIERALAERAPGSAATFRSNADRYVAKLRALDSELKRTFDAVPRERRKLVTDHDAFGYLAARYGIDIVGAAIPSTSTSAQANARETAALIDTIRREGVHAVFSEPSVDSKVVKQIGSETGAAVIPDLYADTLGPPGSGASTYLEMMRHNARVLVEGFNR
jgi:ABC-type Zn uptake system ZnuABC Zn-binding protein ZnuA/ABC-type Mn2+/Zn2+ transport system permease subunit